MIKIPACRQERSEGVSTSAREQVRMEGGRRGMEWWRESRQQCSKTLQALRRSRVSSERAEGVVRES